MRFDVHNMNRRGMIKVLDKSFRMLEYIAAKAPFAVYPGELAESLQINRATCSRLLKSLLDAGFLLHHGRQGGYTPGPRLLTLGMLSSFAAPLLDKVEKSMIPLAEELKATLIFSRIYSGKRYVLLLENRDPKRDIRLIASFFDDLFETATGILDLAYTSTAQERRRFRENAPHPSLILPPFNDPEKMEDNFAAIRREGGFCSFKEEQWIAACPVFAQGSFAGALGLSMLREEADKERIFFCMKRLKEETSKLTFSLSPRGGIG